MERGGDCQTSLPHELTCSPQQGNQKRQLFATFTGLPNTTGRMKTRLKTKASICRKLRPDLLANTSSKVKNVGPTNLLKGGKARKMSRILGSTVVGYTHDWRWEGGVGGKKFP